MINELAHVQVREDCGANFWPDQPNVTSSYTMLSGWTSCTRDQGHFDNNSNQADKFCCIQYRLTQICEFPLAINLG